MNRKATRLIRSNPRLLTVTLFILVVLTVFLASPVNLVGTAMGSSSLTLNWDSHMMLALVIALCSVAVAGGIFYWWRQQRRPQGMYKRVNRRVIWHKLRRKLWQ